MLFPALAVQASCDKMFSMLKVRDRRRLAVISMLGALFCLGVILSGCGSSEEPPVATPTYGDLQRQLTSTPDPYLLMTLQADIAATADEIAGVVSTATPDQVTLAAPPVVLEGTLPADRQDACPLPEDFVLHERDGFCLSAPRSWNPYNMDGGVASTLGTTPGQAISLQPEWAQSAADCHLTIYMTRGYSPDDLLAVQYARLQDRSDLIEVTPPQIQLLGELAIPGFSWLLDGGERGAVYIGVVGVNQLVHITFGGSTCPVDDLFPVLETLRFNSDR
jgi:hypothetical protein